MHKGIAGCSWMLPLQHCRRSFGSKDEWEGRCILVRAYPASQLMQLIVGRELEALIIGEGVVGRQLPFDSGVRAGMVTEFPPSGKNHFWTKPGASRPGVFMANN